MSEVKLLTSYEITTQQTNKQCKMSDIPMQWSVRKFWCRSFIIMGIKDQWIVVTHTVMMATTLDS